MSAQSGSAPPSGGVKHHQSFWLWVMCLTGVDYFSTLGYQPSIAFDSAGRLAPLATVVLVLVTLLGAYPVYAFVSRCSHEGQGSIGMLANLFSGWWAKLLVLTLLGFAATDFVITKTLSAADAAKHLIENSLWPFPVDEAAHGWNFQQIGVTAFLLMLLGAMFMRGFREVIGMAVSIVGVYLVLNIIVIGSGVLYLAEHPAVLEDWWAKVRTGDWVLAESPIAVVPGGDWLMLAAVVFLIFPKLALGLSGFETGVAVMPLIRGEATDDPANPKGRIRNTRKLLLTAALIMSTGLMGSSFVVSTLIPPDALVYFDEEGKPVKPDNWPEGKPKPKARAHERALAYLAHAEPLAVGPEGEKLNPIFGPIFGTVYDISTVVILWFAGASAMAGLLNLVPKYLPRYGMAPEWARAVRPLVILLTAVNLIVTLIFKADVSAQGDAYATGVLVLMTSAAVATVIEKYRTNQGSVARRIAWPYVLIGLIFIYTTAAIVVEKPVGLLISSFFIAAILLVSFISRIARSRELRFAGFKTVDIQSKLLWDTIRDLDLTILVPHRPGRRTLAEKEQSIRREHRIPRDLMVVFVEVELTDASEFVPEQVIHVREEQGRYILRITEAASISHTLAALALEMAKVGRAPEIHFGWTDENILSGTLGFLLFGEGNVPWMVRALIRKAEPNPAKRPLIIIAGA